MKDVNYQLDECPGAKDIELISEKMESENYLRIIKT